MRYLGNKSRLAKHLTPLLTKHLNGSNFYIEPFCGALGMIGNLRYRKRIGIDVDKYIIALMRAVQSGWNPPLSVSDREYLAIKQSPSNFTDELVGFVGYGCSYGGKWFGGLARSVDTKGSPRNMVAESARNLMKMRPKIEGIKLECRSYKSLDPAIGSVVYCDPPYQSTTGYKFEFEHGEFWEWVRRKSLLNYVYVSEYDAPADFRCIWELEHKTGIDRFMAAHSPRKERLFVYSKGLAFE